MTSLGNVGYGLRVRKVARRRAAPSGRSRRWRPSGCRASAGAARRSSPAASGSGSRWPGRWSTGPQVLLLDEPLGALDLKLREEMQVELKAIQREVGITFVFVTHDQEEALTMSDRVAVFNGGRIEQVGPPARSTSGRPPRSSPGSSAPPTCSRRSGREGLARRGRPCTCVRPERSRCCRPGERVAGGRGSGRRGRQTGASGGRVRRGDHARRGRRSTPAAQLVALWPPTGGEGEVRRGDRVRAGLAGGRRLPATAGRRRIRRCPRRGTPDVPGWRAGRPPLGD